VHAVNSRADITHLLQQWRCRDPHAENRLFQQLMPELRRIAARCFRGESRSHTLQPSALVNEAFLRLAQAKSIDWRDRGHFLALAARIMRHQLIDHARARPNVRFTTLDALPERIAAGHSQFELAVAIDRLLEQLERESPQQRRVVELKFFLGLTDAEVAEALNIPMRSLQREWHRARRWLYERLEAGS
jgi:RNA polymerase sigma factor (TIGR02999 family)